MHWPKPFFSMNRSVRRCLVRFQVPESLSYSLLAYSMPDGSLAPMVKAEPDTVSILSAQLPKATRDPRRRPSKWRHKILDDLVWLNIPLVNNVPKRPNEEEGDHGTLNKSFFLHETLTTQLWQQDLWRKLKPKEIGSWWFFDVCQGFFVE